MVPGMANLRGEPIRRLEGPLRWAVELDVRHNTSVATAGPLPPPNSAATGGAAAAGEAGAAAAVPQIS